MASRTSRLILPFLIAISCFFTGCGYQFGIGEGLPSKYSTISVPYVVGDLTGSLTSAVVKEIVQSGAFQYRSSGGILALNIELIDLSEDNIGFRYDRKKKGELTKDIIPTETRITGIVEINVVDTCSNCTVLGPVQITASVDYDHDFYFSRNGVNVFSLGQLTDIDEAYDAVQVPLNQILAQKIVDYISQSW